MKKSTGTVKWFNSRRGFGFVADESGAEYFVHYSDIQMEGFKNLHMDQEVEFIPGEDEQGRTVAYEVVPV